MSEFEKPFLTSFPSLLFADPDLELRAEKGFAEAAQGGDGQTESKPQVSCPAARSLSYLESALVSFSFAFLLSWPPAPLPTCAGTREAGDGEG